MSKRDYEIGELWNETIARLRDPGLLLASCDSKGVPNVMTIGWATLGTIWAKPILTVLVRPSRFTYPLIEEVGDFTVNVPTPELEEVVKYCGTVSGREENKLSRSSLTATPSRHVCSPIIEECVLHYECRVVHKHDLNPNALATDIRHDFYPQENFHRVYYGEILAVYGVEDIRDVI
jgi:flavin reductase (DIM6/NTAB) family NADH-FMN oxidoreductase RutF